MANAVGIRREDKNAWERRAPLTPAAVAALTRAHGIRFVVQPAAHRVFADAEYAAAGAVVSDDLAGCRVVLAVKEIPAHLLRPGTAYAFFSHTVKGQPEGMPLLRRVLEVGATLIDYERVVGPDGRRLVHFGRFAGLAGTLDALWAYGRRLAAQGVRTPFQQLRQTTGYPDLAGALAAVGEVGALIADHGLPAPAGPLVVGVTGYGNVASGALEVLERLPVRRVEPADLGPAYLRAADPRAVHVVGFGEADTLAEASGRPVDVVDYAEHPDHYRSRFAGYLDHLSILVNGIYWDRRAPRLVTRTDLARLAAAGPMRLALIADISCDVEGSVECTVRTTTPDDPVYVYDPGTGRTVDGVAGPGVVVLAVDNLPCELPRESSEAFSRALAPLVPALAAADLSGELAGLALPPELAGAVVAHRGALAPGYAYLAGPMTPGPPSA